MYSFRSQPRGGDWVGMFAACLQKSFPQFESTPQAYGDGQKYHGRGPAQFNGRANYMTSGKALALDLFNQTELLKSRSTPASLQLSTGHPKA